MANVIVPLRHLPIFLHMFFTQYEPNTGTSLSVEPIDLLMSLDSELPQVTTVIYFYFFQLSLLLFSLGVG